MKFLTTIDLSNRARLPGFSRASPEIASHSTDIGAGPATTGSSARHINWRARAADGTYNGIIRTAAPLLRTGWTAASLLWMGWMPQWLFMMIIAAAMIGAAVGVIMWKRAYP